MKKSSQVEKEGEEEHVAVEEESFEIVLELLSEMEEMKGVVGESFELLMEMVVVEGYVEAEEVVEAFWKEFPPCELGFGVPTYTSL